MKRTLSGSPGQSSPGRPVRGPLPDYRATFYNPIPASWLLPPKTHACRRDFAMHKPACFILALFLAVCATAAPRSANADIKKVTSVEGITEYRLDNGLQLLLYPDSSRPTVTVNLTILVGSRHEGYGETGMAHLLEHMVFKGTPKHQSIPKLLQERGARFNGTTWVDRTNYFETLPANEDNLKFALELESDRMVNSYVKHEDLISE